MSVFLGTSRIMCLYACARVILFALQQALSTVTTGGRIEKSTTAREETEALKHTCSHTPKHNIIYPHKHTSVLDICNLSCVRPNAKVTEGRISRCFLLSCSTDETFLVTLLSVSHFSESRRKVKKLTSLLATWFHYCLNWTGFTKASWVSVVNKRKTRQQLSKWQTPNFYGFEGKSLTSTGDDATDHIPVIDSLHFAGSWRGKSSCLV